MFEISKHSSKAGAATSSLVALVALISATDARANAHRVQPGAKDPDLSARVTAAVASIHRTEDARLRDCLPGKSVVAWQN
jgi:hypothetical protein